MAARPVFVVLFVLECDQEDGDSNNAGDKCRAQHGDSFDESVSC